MRAQDWLFGADGIMAYDEDLADRVRAVLLAAELVTERQMVGRVAFMLRGHMFCGVVKDTPHGPAWPRRRQPCA